MSPDHSLDTGFYSTARVDTYRVGALAKCQSPGAPWLEFNEPRFLD